jgi:acetyl-CoA carboxylase biotin carboxyl carrier protein
VPQPDTQPETGPLDPRPAADGESDAAQSIAGRARDHAAVADLADALVPALIARLSATGLAELEIREGPWKLRLRRPLEVHGGGRRAMDHQLRLQAGGHPAGTGTAGGGSRPASAGGSPGSVSAIGSARPDGRSDTGRNEEDPGPPVASAPTVGIFRPAGEIVGRRVQAGDRLGAVDMLGVLQEVASPVDGVVGRLLAEAGDGVEYGQPLVEIQPTPAGRDGAGELR